MNQPWANAHCECIRGTSVIRVINYELRPLLSTAKLKSQRDDMIIAQGKRSAALDCEPQMIVSLFFQAGLARWERVKPAWKMREVGWGGLLPRAAASCLRFATAGGQAALPWAIIVLPFRGAGQNGPEANQTLEPIWNVRRSMC